MRTDVVRDSLMHGVSPAGPLRQRLGVSAATLMRRVREAGPEVVTIGRARATRYGLRHPWPMLGTTRFPVLRVGPDGRAQTAGEIVTLAARQSVWLPDHMEVDGLPIELADAAPSGFLGRQFASIHADLHLPARPEDWSDHHVLLAMSRRGEDLAGDLIVGDESFARWQALVYPAHTRDDYPTLANATIAGHPPGSSAGGERPKFGAFVDGRHVLVKFAARGRSGDVVARRWCDLLALEVLALEVIASRGIPTPRTAIVESESHVCLESERFDRVGFRGRVGVLSLAAVHDNLADPWARAAVRLFEARRLSAEDARRMRWLDAFGAHIANTDRHPHNVVFFTEGGSLRLAPVFDQVSMLYAPTPDGQVPPRIFTPPPATADTLDVWDDARTAAREFWERASVEARVSDDVRLIASANARALRD